MSFDIVDISGWNEMETPQNPLVTQLRAYSQLLSEPTYKSEHHPSPIINNNSSPIVYQRNPQRKSKKETYNLKAIYHQGPFNEVIKYTKVPLNSQEAKYKGLLQPGVSLPDQKERFQLNIEACNQTAEVAEQTPRFQLSCRKLKQNSHPKLSIAHQIHQAQIKTQKQKHRAQLSNSNIGKVASSSSFKVQQQVTEIVQAQPKLDTTHIQKIIRLPKITKIEHLKSQYYLFDDNFSPQPKQQAKKQSLASLSSKFNAQISQNLI